MVNIFDKTKGENFKFCKMQQRRYFFRQRKAYGEPIRTIL